MDPPCVTMFPEYLDQANLPDARVKDWYRGVDIPTLRGLRIVTLRSLMYARSLIPSGR